MQNNYRFGFGLMLVVACLGATVDFAADISIPSELTKLQLQTRSSLVVSDDSGFSAISFDEKKLVSIREFVDSIPMVNFPIVSPNGKLIAYEFQDLSKSRVEQYLCIADVSGKVVKSFPKIRGFGYEWANDNVKLAFMTRGEQHLAVVSTLTGDVKELDSATNQRVSWSPDMQQIAYESKGRIRIHNLTSGLGKDLVPGQSPSWSPDGQWIGIISENKYFVMSPDGNNKRFISTASQRNSPIRWSPDSKYVTFTKMVEKSDDIPILPKYEDNYVVMVVRLSDGSRDWIYRHGGFFPIDFRWILVDN